jgi:RND family efflux transporter MFP subunit
VQSTESADRFKALLMVFLPRLLIILVLFALAGGITKMLVASKSSGEKKLPDVTNIVVNTIESVHRPSNRIWSGYGTVRTMGSADIVAEVAGRVIERPNSVEAGTKIEAGDLIVRLDDTDYINALDSARQVVKSLEAQIDGLKIESEQLQLQVDFATQEIEAAQRDLDRIDEVIAKGVGTSGERDAKLASLMRSFRERSVLQQQFDLVPSRRARLEADLSAQRASERIASENLERSIIRAPFSGELQEIMPRKGDWVGFGSTVARVVDLSDLEIPLKIAASASAWIEVGDEVRLWVRNPNGNHDKTGKIIRIAPEADSASRTMTIFVEVKQDPQDPNRLLPGQFVHGRVVTEDPEQRVILPRRAVQSEHVFVVSELINGERVIKSMPVRVAYSFETALPEIDPIETQWVALEIGYEPVEGDLVAITLLDQLIEGTKVRLVSDVVSSTNTTLGTSDEVDSTEDSTAGSIDGPATGSASNGVSP